MNKILYIAAVLLIFVGCKSPEARKPISVKTGSFIDASVERNKKLNAKEQASIQKILSEKKVEYKASQSGFWYYYNTKIDADSLKTPKFGNIVSFNYDVKSLNGKLIYDVKTQTYAMDKEELFTGMREGLKLMKTGETVTFFFPSLKAYGYYGDQNKIGTNIPLICQVTLNSISEK
ncbi:MAG: gliding motility-associated peptidyl-prolyl isomerase GldI [Flavobacteriaceae bacterium]|nr:gliding motility-associated peptidyl-prolyl isomerase GldI [Flavobacteriaceae bacterium]